MYAAAEFAEAPLPPPRDRRRHTQAYAVLLMNAAGKPFQSLLNAARMRRNNTQPLRVMSWLPSFITDLNASSPPAHDSAKFRKVAESPSDGASGKGSGSTGAKATGGIGAAFRGAVSSFQRILSFAEPSCPSMCSSADAPRRRYDEFDL